MNTEIAIRIRGLTAEATAGQKIICGNSGYTVALYFDEVEGVPWGDYLIKTVRFEWLDTMTGQRRHIDAQYTNQPIPIPTEATQDVYELNVGVYAGNLLSSTPARVPCERCTTDGATFHGDTTPDIYAALLAALANLTGGGSPLVMRPRVREGMFMGHFETLDVPQQMVQLSLLSMAPQGEEEPQDGNNTDTDQR